MRKIFSAGLFLITSVLLTKISPGFSSESRDQNTLQYPAVVVSAHPLATEAGLSILKEGGNAIDAAVAVQMVLNVVEPQSSGIGGGCFILFHPSKGAIRREDSSPNVIAIDGREEAPRQIYPEIFLDDHGKEIPFYPERITGGRSVGVPGCLKALHKAWEKYGSGRILWSRLFEPAVSLAEKGFPISKRLAEAIEGESERLSLFPASREIFFNKDGKPKKAGEILIQKDLGRTFKLIAEQGPAIFYEGEMAQDIVKAVKEAPKAPGFLSLEDMNEYEAPFRKPVSGTYRGFQIYSMPPPSSGGTTLIEALNMLELFPLQTLKPDSSQFIHLFSEAQKLAFADRNRYLGDADFVEIPVRDLVSKELASTRALAIHPDKAIPGKAEATVLIKLGNTSTSHISIIDSDGNVLAMTTTIEHIFGSALVVPGRGFVLNNELTDFDALPYLDEKRNVPAPNRVEGGRKNRKTSLDAADSMGGKRPLSSMSPTILFKDGKPYVCLGSPGGTQIIGVVLNLIVNLVDFKMPAEQAMAWPRVINRNGPVELEKDFFKDEALIHILKEMGHDVLMREPFGNAQLAVVEDTSTGRPVGASDPRGEGKAGFH